MTFDPIIILATITIILNLSCLFLFARLRKSEQTSVDLQHQIITLNQNLEQTSTDLGRLARVVGDTIHASSADGTRITNLRAEFLAQARALDAHDDRLSALEGEQ